MKNQKKRQKIRRKQILESVYQWKLMMNVLLAVQLRPKLSMKAKLYLVFAKFAEEYGQKAGFEKHPILNICL